MILPGKAPAERVPVIFDFSALMDTDVETLSVLMVSCQAKYGADANAGALLDGNAAIDGPRVIQWVKGGAAGVYYRLECRVKISDGRELSLAALLPVVEC